MYAIFNFRGLDPLITYLAATPMSDAKAQGLKKKVVKLFLLQTGYKYTCFLNIFSSFEVIFYN